MNVVEFIEQNLDPRKILEYYGFKQITESSNAFRACCAIHNGNNPSAFIWNKENNLWYCHTGKDCGGGDVFQLVEKIENISFKEAIVKVANILEISIDGMSLEITADRLTTEQKKWLNKQKQRINKEGNSKYELPFTKYFSEHETFKRFSSDVLEHYGAKFCNLYPEEDTMLYGKLVIPLHDEEKCIGVALRDTLGTSKSKWIYMPKHLVLKDVLYNYNTVIELIENQGITEVILVEGIFDVWAYHRIGIDNVVAVLGSFLSNEQFSKLIKLGVNIITSFDNDKAGNKCTEQVIKMFQGKASVYKITFPEGYDPADCSEKELETAYLQRELQL